MKNLIILIILSFAINSFAKIDIVQNDNTLTIINFESPYGVDWSSPAALLRSTVVNDISSLNRRIGHSAVHVRCGNEQRLLGMSHKEMPARELILSKGLGFAVLLIDFPGRIENSKDLEVEINEKSQTGKKINFISHLLSSKTCQRVLKYLDEYQNYDYGKNGLRYGLLNSPRHREGAGCSRFARSVLAVAGLESLYDEKWMHDIAIPNDLIGQPEPVNFISLFSKVLMGANWARKGELAKSIKFWDPDSLFRWVRDSQPANTTVEKYNKAKVLIYDNRKQQPPTEPIWLQ